LVYSQSQFIVAGSDDGLFFVWDKYTENNLLVLKGDSSIVNCVQPHPSEFMLATSGIDNEVKLWTPLPEVIDFTVCEFRFLK
jgi:WD and tetratricopeptide repeat-containing protein 1